MGAVRGVAVLVLGSIVGAGVSLQPVLTSAVCLAGLLGLAYWSRPILVPCFILASALVVHPITQVGGFNLFLSDVVWLPAVPLALLSHHRDRPLARLAPVRWPMATLLITAVFSSLLAADTARAAVGTFQLLELFTIAWVTVAFVRTPHQVSRVLVVAAIVVAVDALLALGQLVDLVPIEQLPLAAGSDVGRVTGVSGNALGTFLVLGLVLVLGLWLGLPRRSARPMPALGIGMLGALVATGIRSAWLSFALCLLLALLLGLRHSRRFTGRRTAALLGLGATLMVSLILLGDRGVIPSVYVERLTSISGFAEAQTGSTTYARLRFWETSLRMIEQNPLLGVGPKNWVVEKWQYGLPSSVVGLSTDEIVDPHHALLEVAAEQGLVAVAAILALYLISIRLCLRGLGSGSWAPSVAIPLMLVSAARPLSQLAGGDVGTDKTWYVMLGLVASAASFYGRQRKQSAGEGPGTSPPQLQLSRSCR